MSAAGVVAEPERRSDVPQPSARIPERHHPLALDGGQLRLATSTDSTPPAWSCAVCGRPLPGHHRGRPRSYCSDACKARAKLGRRVRRPRKPKRTHPCVVCGAPVAGQRKTCSDACHRKSLGQHERRQATCPMCGETFLAVVAPRQIYCSVRCQWRAVNAGNHRSRARRFGVPYEHISRRRVFERDGYRCHICGRRTRRSSRPMSPRYPTIDHLVPIAAGGSHTYDNVACACHRCNQQKSDGVAPGGDQLRLIG